MMLYTHLCSTQPENVCTAVNETGAATRNGLEEAPAGSRPSAPLEQPKCSIRRPEEASGKDLRGRDLSEIKELLPAHLAGADLTGAKLPDEVAKFPALGQVAEISTEARKVFIGLLAACVYSWLVIGTTTDFALILNTASSPLPIINTPVPIANFYVVGAAILAAVYCYFHFYLQRLWRVLATLPAVFPDGVSLDDRTDPWLLSNLVCTEFVHLRGTAPPLTRLENFLAITLAWWLVPLTLGALWVRYLPAHYWLGTIWLVAVIGVTVLFGRHSYRLARATLRGETLAPQDDRDEGLSVLGRAWHEFCQMRPDRFTLCIVAFLAVCSISAFHDNPRDPHTWVAKGLNALSFVGIRTYADLREVEVAQKPEGWDGSNWSEVKRVDLRGRNLAFADATRVFLPNSDLRGADLTSAFLGGAQLQGAKFYDENRDRRARLPSVDLRGAQLQDADLRDAELQRANLSGAQLRGAVLVGAQLQKADLSNAWLEGADLSNAWLLGANLSSAWLQGANLRTAQLRGANLSQAKLQGADLSAAQLQGADLRSAQLQGADLQRAALGHAIVGIAPTRRVVGGTQWDFADLRDFNVWPMDAPRTWRPARPYFPDELLKRPNVMFNASDPTPEPLVWGSPKWATEMAYDEDLAGFLADLACERDVPEAQTWNLARRALHWSNRDRPFATRLAARIAGPDCPPAKELPEDLRRQLNQLREPAALDMAPGTS
jgi:uncharacterized protein YjbI with pentapeptide repeats